MNEWIDFNQEHFTQMIVERVSCNKISKSKGYSKEEKLLFKQKASKFYFI